MPDKELEDFRLEFINLINKIFTECHIPTENYPKDIDGEIDRTKYIQQVKTDLEICKEFYASRIEKANVLLKIIDGFLDNKE